MAAESTNNIIINRATLSLIGGVAGLCLWLLVDVLEDVIDNERTFLFIVCLTGAFFSILLGIVGPLSARRATLVAVSVALPSSLLLLWASLRFGEIGGNNGFLETGHPILAFAVLVTIPLPFLMAQMRQGENWRQYPVLFDHSWGIVVRYAAAWVFVGVFWAVLLLSHALLNIVGLDIIDVLLKIEPLPFVLNGLVLGLAIAVVHEMAAYVSPYLILRLLRLLLPMVLLVVGIFILALPFRGLSGLFGGLSATLVLIAMIAGAATLVTTALDQTDDEAVQSPMMRAFAQFLAVLILVLAVLAAYGIGVRVAQYGWTPHRIAAASVALISVGYGLLYALAVVQREGWMARIRVANIYMALATILLAALWLTPLINPQRISTNSQIARFEAGKSDVEQLAAWQIGREWGYAGQAGVERLLAMTNHKDYAVLQGQIARMQTSNSSHQFSSGADSISLATTIDSILAVMSVLPEQSAGSRAMLETLGKYALGRINEGCTQLTPAGNPGCIMLFTDLSSTDEESEISIIFMSGNSGMDILMRRFDGKKYRSIRYGEGNFARMVSQMDAADIDTLITGAYSIKPFEMNGLHLNGKVLYIGP